MFTTSRVALCSHQMHLATIGLTTLLLCLFTTMAAAESSLAPSTSLRPLARPVSSLAPTVSLRPKPRPVFVCITLERHQRAIEALVK